MKRHHLFSLLVAAFPLWQAFGQISPLDSTSHRSDSLATQVRDSLQLRADSLFRYHAPPLAGSIDHALDTNRVMTAAEIPWYDVRYLGDALAVFPGVYIRDQQGVGQYNQPSFMGTDWRGIAVLSDGRPLADPASGTFNLFLYPPENVERIEVITGTRGFLYGFSGAGGTVNIVTKNFNNNTPFTKIDFSQSGYSYETSDASFSQNLSRRLNLSFGLRHQGTDGRFRNSSADIWNLRGKVRWAITPTLALILSDTYGSALMGMNGGDVPSQTGTLQAFSVSFAQVHNTQSYEKLFRHELDLSLAGNIFDDSTAHTLLTFYYAHNERQYRDVNDRGSDNGVFLMSDHLSLWEGALLKQEWRTGPHQWLAGASAEVRQVEASPNIGRQHTTLISLWGKDQVQILTPLTLSLYGRLDWIRGETLSGAGVDLTLQLFAPLSLFGGISVSRRAPNELELYWADSIVSRPGPIVAEKHRMAEIGVSFVTANADVRITGFQRRVTSPILLERFGGNIFPSFSVLNGDQNTFTGISLRFLIRPWVLAIEGSGTYMTGSGGAATTLYPQFSGQGGVYYWRTMFDGHLDLKVGFRGSGQSSQTGEVFNPEALTYVRNIDRKIGAGAKVDFVLLARIGNAHIHLVWENLTSEQYFTTPYYPELDQLVRFGIAWELFN
jgi:outer membrane receptor protein involved in Fe transport